MFELLPNLKYLDGYDQDQEAEDENEDDEDDGKLTSNPLSCNIFSTLQMTILISICMSRQSAIPFTFFIYTRGSTNINQSASYSVKIYLWP